MIGALILFTQFFTRIEIPVEVPEPMAKFNHSVQYLPLFGLILGLIEAAIFIGLSYLFPVTFAWVIVILLDALITGGFHLDAFADTADAIFSSRTPARMREIMKDSRLGTMGVLALITYYAITLTSIMGLKINLDRWQLAAVIAVLIMTSKAGLAILTFHMHYAGEHGGLAEMWQGVKTWQIIVAEVIYGLATFLLTGVFGVISASVVLICAWPYQHKFVHLFGGLTGDTLGSYTCLAQLIFIVVYMGLVINL